MRVSWDIEVDHEAAKLVKQGWPPYKAVEEAVKRLREHRSTKPTETPGGKERP